MRTRRHVSPPVLLAAALLFLLPEPGLGGAPAPPAQIQAAHDAYARDVARKLRQCISGERRPAAAPDGKPRGGIETVCACYVDFEPEHPSFHSLELSIDAEGKITGARDTAPGARGRIGECKASSLRGLRMPAPPGPTVLEIRLTDFFLGRGEGTAPAPTAPGTAEPGAEKKSP